jgi:hypothetical protein
MTPGELLLAAPLLLATLVWVCSTRIRGKAGKSLPTFLFGYLAIVTYNGFVDLARYWSRPHEWSGYISLVLWASFASYITGGIGWWILASFRQSLLEGLRWWLSLSSDSRDSESTTFKKIVTSEREAAVQKSRQQTIEECAEEAYEYLMKNEVEISVDYDLVEKTAGRLRDAILALGETV